MRAFLRDHWDEMSCTHTVLQYCTLAPLFVLYVCGQDEVYVWSLYFLFYFGVFFCEMASVWPLLSAYDQDNMLDNWQKTKFKTLLVWIVDGILMVMEEKYCAHYHHTYTRRIDIFNVTFNSYFVGLRFNYCTKAFCTIQSMLEQTKHNYMLKWRVVLNLN